MASCKHSCWPVSPLRAHEPLYFYWGLYEGERWPKPTYGYDNVTVRDSYYQSGLLHFSQNAN